MRIQDPNGISLVSHADTHNDASRIDKAARGLEGQFAKLLIGSLHNSGLGEESALFPGAAGHYRDLYDAQLADMLTRGRGLGLRESIQRDLQARTASTPDAGMPGVTRSEQTARTALQALNRQAGENAGSKPMPLPARQSGQAPAPASPTLSPRPAATAAAHRAYQPSPEDFVARIWPHAEQAAASLGVPPQMLVAQAALETGWGRHLPRQADGSSGNNLFGIKGGGRWQGEQLNASTREFSGGKMQKTNALFRSYGSPAESFADYVSLLKNNPRYADAVGNASPRGFAQALQKAGYATDPDYAAKLNAIAEGPTLRRALTSLASAGKLTTTKV